MALFFGTHADDTATDDRIAAQLGIKIVRPEPQPVAVWPDHWPAVRVLEATVTQWRRDIHGRRTGLHYEVLPAVMDLLQIEPDDRPHAFNDLRQMEAVVLDRLSQLNAPPPGRQVPPTTAGA